MHQRSIWRTWPDNQNEKWLCIESEQRVIWRWTRHHLRILWKNTGSIEIERYRRRRAYTESEEIKTILPISYWASKEATRSKTHKAKVISKEEIGSQNWRRRDKDWKLREKKRRSGGYERREEKRQIEEEIKRRGGGEDQEKKRMRFKFITHRSPSSCQTECHLSRRA